MENLIEDIKNHMLSNLSYSNIGEYYDEDGHCAYKLGKRIEFFWKNFNQDKIIYVASGEFEEDIDLNGGRSYLIDRSNLSILLFNYLFFVKNFTIEDYKRIIYNSNELTDNITLLFNQKKVIRHNKIDKILK